MVPELLAGLESSWLGQSARGSVWLYPIANLLHVVGAALALGSIAVFDVLMLRRRWDTARTVAPVALGVAATGIAVQVVTGLVLLSAEAGATGANPAFLVKLALIVLALANVAAFHLSRTPWSAPFRAAQAAVSLGVWTGVVLAGRLIAYV